MDLQHPTRIIGAIAVELLSEEILNDGVLEPISKNARKQNRDGNSQKSISQ